MCVLKIGTVYGIFVGIIGLECLSWTSRHLTGLKVQTEADVFTATDFLHSKGISTVVLSSLDSDAISITTYVSHQNGMTAILRLCRNTPGCTL